jgi:uncharacterized protein
MVSRLAEISERHLLHVAIFCRPLVAGAVKTRLIPAYGADAAKQIYAQLVSRTLRTVDAARYALHAHASLWVAGDTAHESVRNWARQHDLPMHQQCDGELGVRMSDCIAQLLMRYEKVLLIGTDCAALTVPDLRAAADALSQACPWVFTPADDGGYVLVGSNQASAAPFLNVAWSTAETMAQTRQALRVAALCWAETPPLWDVDEPADVDRARACGFLDTF